MESLLVKLPNWMGDILFSFDLLHSLSQRFGRIGLMTSEEHAELFSVFQFPNSELLTYPSGSWPHLDIESLQKIDRFRPDAGLLLPNSFGSALILKFAGVPSLFGYQTEGRKFLLNHTIPVPPQKIHQTEYYCGLLSLFDLTRVSYPSPQPGSRNRLIVIHPGASKPERAWNMERYIQLGSIFKGEGYDILFISGEQIETDGHPVHVRPGLKEFCDALQRCALFIGNDSGPLHLAQQCGAAVVGIYGPGDPMVTGPRPISASKIVYHAYPCSPCRQKFFVECDPSPSRKPFCIDTIQVREVVTAAKQLLQN